MKYVVNASNTNMTYAFFLPIVCRMWQNSGYSPLVILLGNPAEWLARQRTACVLKHIQKNTPHLIFVERVQGFRDSTVVQLSRLFCSVYPGLKADDYLLTSDVDMLPFSQTYFHQQDAGYAFHLFGGDMHSGSRFPLCYLGACKKAWLKVMGIEGETDLHTTLVNHLDPRRDDWNYDEELFAEKIIRSEYWKEQCQLINRGWDGWIARKRLDRAWWNIPLDRDLIDCHSVRPGNDNWELLQPVFKLFCTGEDCRYFDEYKTEYDLAGN